MAQSIDALRKGVRGEVVATGDPGYDAARKVYNGMIDRRPLAVVRPIDTSDVAAAVAFAREGGLDLSVRGGSHGVAGFGTNDGGVVIDLSPMRSVRVDPDARTACAQGGCTWGDFYAATYPFGLSTTGGIISSTGIGGLTLGGGMGHIARRCGLTIDNLLSAEVVTADGRLLTASEREHPDLYWALRGGGGNFGVVTTFEYRLHPVGDVYVGIFFFELSAAADVLDFYRRYLPTAPEELSAFFAFQIAPPLPFIPQARHGETFCALVSCWSGALEKGESALGELRAAGPVAAEMVAPMPFPALNGLFDPLMTAGLQHYWKASWVDEITDGAIAAHVAHGPTVPALTSTMHIYPVNGACHRVAADATAFAARDASYVAIVAGAWPDPADNERNVRWVRDYYAALAPHSLPTSYVNFLGGDEAGRVRESYGANYERLARVKREYDPGNLFHLNQNIAPAST